MRYSIFPLSLIVGIFFMGGCTEQDFSTTAPSAAVSEIIPINSEQNQLSFLSLPSINASMQKSSVSRFITVRDGGEIFLTEQFTFTWLHHKKGEKEATVTVQMTLKFPSNSVPYDANVDAVLNRDIVGASVGIEFGPHGMAFNKPAEMTLEVWGLFLDGVDQSNSGFYYVNGPNNTWIRTEVSEIKVDIPNKYLKVKNAKLPHFSQYAFAYVKK